MPMARIRELGNAEEEQTHRRVKTSTEAESLFSANRKVDT